MAALRSKNELVSIVTPVFNGAPYLSECIESVLGQTHGNFEYIIADNCSTDSSLSIARRYADSDKRIRVVEAGEHVGPIQNWNRSLAETDPNSDYIKFVHADDWLYPDCIEKMVEVASGDARIGIVSAYRLEEDRVSLDRLPEQTTGPSSERQFCMDGRDVVRAIFLEYASVLGSPTSLLFRADAVAGHEPFFDESFLHADKEACIRILKERRFGFVREVLTFTRRHNESVTSKTNVLDTRRQDDLLILRRHGGEFLSNDELKAVLEKTVRLYYAYLGRSIGCAKGGEFWRSHREIFARADIPYERRRLLGALIRHWLDPRSAFNYLRGNASYAPRGKSASDADKFISESRKG